MREPVNDTRTASGQQAQLLGRNRISTADGGVASCADAMPETCVCTVVAYSLTFRDAFLEKLQRISVESGSVPLPL